MRFFRKIFNSSTSITNSKNGILGPEWLDPYTEPIKDPYKLRDDEWRRSLVSRIGNRCFKIQYYGTKSNSGIVVPNEEEDLIVKAVCKDSSEEIILYNSSLIGYNNIFLKGRIYADVEKIDFQGYYDKESNDEFFVILSAIYSFNYDELILPSDIDENDKIDIFGRRFSLDEIKRNGCDYYEIQLMNINNIKTILVSEELS